MDMHHVDKNTPTFAFTSDQWKEEYDHMCNMRFNIDVTRSNENIRNHIFLDNIEKGDTFFFWFCQHPLRITNYCFTNACMGVEPSQEIINLPTSP
jgi:hypothetical protein